MKLSQIFTNFFNEFALLTYISLIDSRIDTYYNMGGTMKTQELLKLLKKNGCYILRSGSRHDIWYSKISGKQFSVPRHKADTGGCGPTGRNFTQGREIICWTV